MSKTDSHSRLDRLSPEQEARLPEFRDRWLARGLSVELGDVPAAKDAICRAYAVAGLSTPSIWIILASPLHGVMGAAILAQVWDQVRDQAWDQVGAQVRDQVGDQLSRCGYGLHDAPWLGFYDFYREACGLTVCNRLVPMMDLALHGGWWWPFRNACILTPKPSALHRDERGRLHRTDGPALDYGGTFGIWAWQGVRVDRGIIEQPDTITAEQVLAEQNAEIARVMMERMTPERFIQETNPMTLDEDVDGAGQKRQLLAVDMPWDPDRRVVAVRVRCPSTGRQYLLRVPPDMRSCQQAVAWSFNIESPDLYRPLVEQ